MDWEAEEEHKISGLTHKVVGHTLHYSKEQKRNPRLAGDSCFGLTNLEKFKDNPIRDL